MSFLSGRSRLLLVAITGLALLLCALGAAGGALAAPGAISGLTSLSHADAATWYSNPDPSFTWSPLVGVVGYSYALDQLPGGIPSADPVTLPAVAFAARKDITSGAQPWGVAVADINNDGNADLASANWADGSASVTLGDGHGGFSAPTNYDTGLLTNLTNSHSVAFGHVDGDSFLDLIVTSRGSGKVWVLLGNGDGTFAAPVIYDVNFATGGGAKQVVAANFDTSTARDELAIASATENGVRVFHSDASGTLQTPGVLFPAGSQPEALVAGSFNADTFLDLAVTNFDTATVSILLGDGAGGFAAPVGYAVGVQPHSVASGDFNGDGKTDLAVANYSGITVSVLLGIGDGTFQPKVDYGDQLFSVPSAVAVADFSGDGQLDLAVADWGLDDVQVLLGNGDGTFDDSGTASFALGDQPNALVTGDFNNDQSPDLVAAQSGLASDTLGVLTSIPLSASFTGIGDSVWYFHVRAVDGSLAGGPTSTRVVRIDTTAPAGSFTLNGGAATTATPAVTVGSSVSDANGIAAIRFSTDGKATWSSWGPYNATATLTLPAGNGAKTVWAQYEDPAGNVFERSASITLATPTPTPTPTPKVTLKLSGLKSGAIKLGKRVTAKGAVTPTSLAGSKVTLTVQKKKGAKWLKVKSTGRTTSAAAAYSWKYKPARKGAYRMKAAIAKTAAHTAAGTAWRSFRVR